MSADRVAFHSPALGLVCLELSVPTLERLASVEGTALELREPISGTLIAVHAVRRDRVLADPFGEEIDVPVELPAGVLRRLAERPQWAVVAVGHDARAAGVSWVAVGRQIGELELVQIVEEVHTMRAERGSLGSVTRAAGAFRVLGDAVRHVEPVQPTTLWQRARRRWRCWTRGHEWGRWRRVDRLGHRRCARCHAGQWVRTKGEGDG